MNNERRFFDYVERQALMDVHGGRQAAGEQQARVQAAICHERVNDFFLHVDGLLRLPRGRDLGEAEQAVAVFLFFPPKLS